MQSKSQLLCNTFRICRFLLNCRDQELRHAPHASQAIASEARCTVDRNSIVISIRTVQDIVYIDFTEIF